MHRDCGVDQVASKGAEPSENSILVRARKPGVADDVGYQDRRELAGLAHGASAEAGGPTMSDTKIAASLRVSLTALAPKQADSRGAVA